MTTKNQTKPSELFEQAVAFIIEVEGGISDHANDKGGLTKYGISKASYPKLDIAKLTEAQAIKIYHQDYWLANGCDDLPAGFAIALFGFAINSGCKRAKMMLQKALKVKEDGVIGKVSIKAANQATDEHLNDYFAYRARYLHSLMNPVFTHGWLGRVFQLRAFIATL